MSKGNIETDFLVVGAGPAGMIMALQLSQAGHCVTLIEKLKQVIRPVCGEYLSPQGVKYLRLLDLESSIEGFDHIQGMTLYSVKGKKVSTRFPQGAYGVALNRKIFHTRLLEKCHKSGCKVIFDAHMENIQENSLGYLVKLTDAEIRAKWIIGADGRQSTTARLLNLKSLPPLQKKVALHCFLNPKVPLMPFGQMHILEGGSYIGINPIEKNEVNFSIVTCQEDIRKAGSTRELINFWISQRPDLSNQFNLLTGEEIKTTSPLTRRSIEVAKGNAVLVGDASGFIDPLTGEGITTAIKTVHMLYEEIQKYQNMEVAFQQYAKRRKLDFAEKEQLNYHFQTLIKHATATDLVGMFLNLSQQLRNTFIGVIGNIYTPSEGIKVLIRQFLTERG